MKTSFIIIAILLLFGVYFRSEDSKTDILSLKISARPDTSPRKKPVALSNLQPAEIAKAEKPPSPQVKEAPIIVVTPEKIEKETSQATPELGGEIRIFLPLNKEKKDAYLIVVPKDWNAPSDEKFNPLLSKYRASWAVSLRKKRTENFFSNKNLPRGAYSILLYKNDGNHNRKPTLVGHYEVSSGGHAYIKQEHWDQLKSL